ncbi:MAG: Cof-type HAD-IIB family hydrolase [Chitinivibrionales bacterium]|nr:Cof-type HAD-IIB family hydrolase [Chitinivibrionales bacterium]
MTKKLFAFDLDGTLLNSEKQISSANAAALKEMVASGAVVALATGRLASSVAQYTTDPDIDLALLTLNGAAVYTGKGDNNQLIYSAKLDLEHVDFLVDYAWEKPYAFNYYNDDGKLFTTRTKLSTRWIDLYYQQTKTEYNFIDSFDTLRKQSPFKIIFVGDPGDLDKEEVTLKKKFSESVYIVRSWDYYLEFLNPQANKARGLKALADAYGIDLDNVVAFGDADNDVPLLATAGKGIAMKNGSPKAKAAANVVSEWTNDEDAVAREWERLKAER